MNANENGMPCPVDGAQLLMSERQGIEIDYCPSCRGVWLDRGELDKLIERSAADAPQQVHTASPYPPEQRHHGHPRQKRRKSFLEELFD